MHTEQELQQLIWEQLQRAVTDRNHAWRTPVLAGVDEQGLPQARTVILRGADAEAQRLVMYTDHRSPKVAEFALRPQAVLVFWSKELSWQLRLAAEIQVETEGTIVEAAWDQVQSTGAAADYLSTQAPGSPIQANDGKFTEPHALGVIIASVQSIDWLELTRQGHRRALLSGDGMQWLTP